MTTQTQGVCDNCQRPYDRRRAWHRFCSAECRRGYNRTALQKEAAEALEIVQVLDGKMGKGWTKGLAEALTNLTKDKAA